jgi:formylmethanofuran dehydrogenase subunit E
MKCTECGRSFYWNYQAAGYSKPICFNCAEGKD